MRRAILNFIKKLLGLADEEEVVTKPIKDFADKITNSPPIENNLEHSGTRRVEKPCLEDYIEIAKEKYANRDALDYYYSNGFYIKSEYSYSGYNSGRKEIAIHLFYSHIYNIKSIHGVCGLLTCNLEYYDSKERLREKWEHFNEEVEMARRKIKLYYNHNE